MSFKHPDGTIWFTAIISDSNAAFLDGTTAPLAEYASAATTIPLDLNQTGPSPSAGCQEAMEEETRHWDDT